MSGAIWFIGDTHFGHEKVSGLRGFTHPDYHDAALAGKWLKQVKNEDLVYVMGDVSGGSRTGERAALEFLATLPGRKRLIAGNHDSISSIHRKMSPHTGLFAEVFERVSDFGRIRVAGREVLLSHYPYTADHTEAGPRYAQYRLKNLGLPLVHAHTHSTERVDPLSLPAERIELCVSWEAWGRLVNLGDVSQWLDSIPQDVPS